MSAYKAALTLLDPAPDSPRRMGRRVVLKANDDVFQMMPYASRLPMDELPNGDFILPLAMEELTRAPGYHHHHHHEDSTHVLRFKLTVDGTTTLAEGSMDLSNLFLEASSLSMSSSSSMQFQKRIQRFHVAIPLASDELVERAVRKHRPLARLKIHGFREISEERSQRPGPLIMEQAELVLTPVTGNILYAKSSSYIGSELLQGAVPEHRIPLELAAIGQTLAHGTVLSAGNSSVVAGPCVYFMGRKLASSSSQGSQDFHPLGTASQTVFAIAFMQFLQKEKGQRLAAILHDRSAVARLLVAADSLHVMQGLETLYGGPDKVPTLHQLLHHTSGLPQAFDMMPGDLDAMLATYPKAENARIVSGHESSEECFGSLLRERCSLVNSGQGNVRHESPLNYAILKFMLSSHSVGWAMTRLFESAPSSIRNHHKCEDDTSVYGGYNGIALTLEALGWLLGDPAWVPEQWREGSVQTNLMESATQLYAEAWPVPGANAVMGAGNLLLLDTPHAPILCGVLVGIHGLHICVGVVMPTIGLSASEFSTIEPTTAASPGLVRRMVLDLINRVVSGLKLDLSTLNKPDLLKAMGALAVPAPVLPVVREMDFLPKEFVGMENKMFPLLVNTHQALPMAVQLSASPVPTFSFVGVMGYTTSLDLVIDDDGDSGMVWLVDPLSKRPAERLGFFRVHSDRASHLSEPLLQAFGRLYGFYDLMVDIIGLMLPRSSARSKELYDRQFAARTRAAEHKELYRQMIKPLAIPKSERQEDNELPALVGEEVSDSDSDSYQDSDQDQDSDQESASPEILRQIFDLMLARQRALVDPDVGSALYPTQESEQWNLAVNGLWASAPQRSRFYALCMAHPTNTPLIPCEPLLALVGGTGGN